MFSYPARFAVASDGVTVTFRDVPEAITDAQNVEEAADLAVDALETALSIYVENRRDLPRPTARRGSERLVSLSALASAKARPYASMREKGVSNALLARRLGCPLAHVAKLLDLTHSSSVGQIERALATLGKRLTIAVRDAA